MVAVFRADASTGIGIGHIMRCLCLADGLKTRGVDCVFVSRSYSGNLFRKVEKKGFVVYAIDPNADLELDLELTAKVVEKYEADILVTDSYQITSDYLGRARNRQKILVSVDDLAQDHFCSDILLNQNLGVMPEDYKGKVEPYTKLLLGHNYALLRDEFIKGHAQEKQVIPDAKNILVTLGGGGASGQIFKIIKALSGINSLSVNILIGPSYQETEELGKFIIDYPNIHVLKDCQDVAERMLWADLAISAGGSTCWELACLGVPNLIIVLADNQRHVTQELERQGVSINLGWFEDVSEENVRENVLVLLSDPQRREDMSKKGKQLIDGHGVERVIDEIFNSLDAL